MSSLKRKHNLLDDKEKREIISYAKENPKLTQQQIADNLTIKWDLPIKRRSVRDILNYNKYVHTIVSFLAAQNFIC
jgi:transposase